MDRPDTLRRDFIRFGGLGLAAAAASGAPAFAAPATAVRAFYNVRDFGAKGDGKTLDTPAINRAIEVCAASGGGTVLLPAGDYLCFSIHLKSKVHLLLSRGTTIIAADSPTPGNATGYGGGRYDDAESNGVFDPYQDFGHNHWHNSLIWGEDLTDISIGGPGLIWGRGLSHGRHGIHMLDNPFVAEQQGAADKAIALKNCRNVQITDLSMLKCGHFALLLTGVDNLIINNLLIDTDRDGMDIDCCKNVRVSNCAVNSPWDDAICPKSSYGLGYARATENVTITNCYVSGCWILGTLLDGTRKPYNNPEVAQQIGRIKLGTESNGGFKNIAISNCVFEGCNGLALETVDGALLEDIAITNITMRDIITCPIFIRLGARLRGPKESTSMGALRRVVISNLTAHNCAAKFGSIISAVPGYAVEDVKFTNIFIDSLGGGGPETASIVVPEVEDKYPEPTMFGALPTYGFYFRHVRNLEMSHVEVRPQAPDARPAFYLDDVARADFFAITAPRDPAFALHKVTDLRIAWSRATADASLASADGKTL